MSRIHWWANAGRLRGRWFIQGDWWLLVVSARWNIWLNLPTPRHVANTLKCFDNNAGRYYSNKISKRNLWRSNQARSEDESPIPAWHPDFRTVLLTFPCLFRGELPWKSCRWECGEEESGTSIVINCLIMIIKIKSTITHLFYRLYLMAKMRVSTSEAEEIF
jgi:hypothetical protein